MHRILLSLTAACVTISAAALLAPASAMTVRTASGIKAAIEENNAVDQVVYVCWWQPGGYSWRPWRRWRRY